MKNKENALESANPKNQNNHSTKYRLLSILKNANRPVTRGELVDMLDTSDRAVRRCVSELIEEGYRIDSTSHRAGYTLNDEESCKASARECRAKAMKELRKAKILEGYDPDQISMVEVM
ncbi:helix-turn-helix domain-containing protein [Ihubacter sp. rT4E-8]|uniref:helix-turn-helix domain-containing protein n=1 Tax=Ihubacter sp. rT4E-8 TaxID=3242369 RepID=UPI003CE9FEFC